MADFNPDEFVSSSSKPSAQAGRPAGMAAAAAGPAPGKGMFGGSPAQPQGQPQQDKKLTTGQKVGIGAAATAATAGLATGLGFLIKHEVDKKNQHNQLAQQQQQAQAQAIAQANLAAANAQTAAQQAQAQAQQAQQQAAQFQQQLSQLQGQVKPQPYTPQQNYAPPPSNTQYHTIQSGDTYWALSQRYGTTVDALCQLNPGVNYNNLQIGQQIRIR